MSATLIISKRNIKMTIENLQKLCKFYNNCNTLSEQTRQILIDNLIKKGAR